MRVLEESAASDGSARIANGIPGLNLTEMTFHEMIKKLHTMLSGNSVDSQLTSQVISQVLELGYKISNEFENEVRNRILGASAEVERNCGPDLRQSRQSLTGSVHKLQAAINDAVINRIIQDLADISSPLKQFTDAVLSQEAIQRKRELVEQRGQGLKTFSGRLAKTANIVAFANAKNKQRSENLLHLSTQVQNLTPQLVNAGTIKMNYPDHKAADENFENLRKQYAAGVQTIRDFCDEAIDIKTFLKQTSDHIQVRLRGLQSPVTSSRVSGRDQNLRGRSEEQTVPGHRGEHHSRRQALQQAADGPGQRVGELRRHQPEEADQPVGKQAEDGDSTVR